MPTTVETILYVDDEEGNRIVFEEAFGRDFRITTAESAEQALEMLERQPAAVVITDQRMPGMSGNELLELVRDKYPTSVRMVITAYGDLDPILRAVNDGLVSRYLVKPWRPAELKKMLTWGLQAHAMGIRDSELQERLMRVERLVALGRISAAIMHDVSQPVGYIRTNVERIADLSESFAILQRLVNDHTDEIPEAHRRNLGLIFEELPEITSELLIGCDILVQISSSMREILSGGSGALGQPVSADPRAVINYAMAVCRYDACETHCDLRYDGPNTLPDVAIPFSDLAQTMVNLMTNAAQSLGRKEPPGGHVIVEATVSDEHVCLTIIDNGPGMTADVLENVGQQFFTTRPDGIGLGVAECRRLTERAGGTLEIESSEGQGTTVAVTLPRAK